MKVVTNPGPLYEHATDAFYAAGQDVLDYAMRTAPAVSGKYRDSLRMWRRKRTSGPTARIGSRLPYAGALEHGAWTRQGRGPHIARAAAPQPLGHAAEKFPGLYTTRLRTTRIHGSAHVGSLFGREIGTPLLDLSG